MERLRTRDRDRISEIELRAGIWRRGARTDGVNCERLRGVDQSTRTTDPRGNIASPDSGADDVMGWHRPRRHGVDRRGSVPIGTYHEKRVFADNDVFSPEACARCDPKSLERDPAVFAHWRRLREIQQRNPFLRGIRPGTPQALPLVHVGTGRVAKP